MESLQSKLFFYAVIVLSASFHEFAHAFVAFRLGDDTAKREGRLTMNPLAHLDPLGTIVIPLILLLTSGMFIGWAKPVPYNPARLRDQRHGSLKVGLAGPAANMGIALVLGLLIRVGFYLPAFGEKTVFMSLLANIVLINIFLALFNLIPIPPLDGSKIVADLLPRSRFIMAQIGFMGVFIALIVASYILSPAAFFLFRLIVGT